ncbi:Thiosulfate sulfurtransferase rdl2, mitochondrial [Sporothrix epigloea]|uniref:Thiosulfate sulfurtransferase rdl2, mitochondrial n=1 Tax=Sporothrix epigloea TaxID=1892477 RepID=A0ABP0D3Q7_9PEZI
MAATLNRQAARAVLALPRRAAVMPVSVTMARRTWAVANCMQKDSGRQYLIAAGKTATFPQSLLGRRAYSSSAPADHKIWSFESMQKLVTKPGTSIVIIDVREPAELQDTGRIPGSINIPIKTAPDGFFLPDEDFEDRFGFVRPDRDTEVIFYCRSGVRSRAAAGLAKEAGWTKVGEYPGSWLDWSGKGGKVER